MRSPWTKTTDNFAPSVPFHDKICAVSLLPGRRANKRVILWTLGALICNALVPFLPSVARPLLFSSPQNLTVAALWCIGMIGLFWLTRREECVERRAKLEHELRHALFHSSGFGMIRTSYERCIWEVNQRTCEMLEFENQQLIGKSLDSLFGSTAAFLAFAEQGQVQSSTGAIALDWPIRKSDGSLLWCAVSVSLIDLNQPEMGYICGLTDVSKLYGTQESLERTNAALLQARDEALSAVRAKSNFLANMSHEVRTPLHGILGTVELLRHTQLTPEQAEYASTISRSGDGLLSILNDILDYSKVEAGQLQIERAAFSILHDVHEVAILFKSRVDPSLVAFELHADESIPTHVEGDSIRFRQVISNLISNATKFTIRGKICVRLKRINADVDMCKIGIEVSDTGIGISSEQKAQLFRPFSQADSSTARRYGGSGLGLALVKRLVEAMGGTISLHSKLNVGSTFHVELPFGLVTCPATVDAKSPALRLALPSLVTESCPQPRVLIVEDIAVNRMIAKKLVESAGATVTVASNGIEAIDAYKRHSFDAILMDCQMPEMDGYEATTWIREFERGTQRHVPIIAMTAAAMAEDRKRCLDAGMDDYISKPVSGDSLMKCIGDWLLKSRRLDLM